MRGMVLGETKSSLTELRRGVVEHCVLALLARRELYAFDLVRALADRRLVTSEGTIYPLLARLRGEGLATTTWEESEVGPPRRYYRITADGRRALDAFVGEWTSFRDAVDALLREDQDGVVG